MRISDWSSDVCSSDLRTLRPAHHNLHIRSGRRAALRDVHPTGLAGPITATTATPVHDPRAIGRGAAKKRRMLWIRGYGPINGRQSLGRSIAIEKAVLPRHPLQLPDTETNHGRSEEHTSELQSLMRISYAVFCLQKNKKNNTS